MLGKNGAKIMTKVSLIIHEMHLTSSGDIHFWIYDDVTKNGVLDLSGKISIRITFSPLLL